MSLQSVNNVHSGNSLPLGVFSVSDGVSDDVVKETLKNVSDLLVNAERDSLDSSSSGESSDGRLGDTFNDGSGVSLVGSLDWDLSVSFS